MTVTCSSLALPTIPSDAEVCVWFMSCVFSTPLVSVPCILRGIFIFFGSEYPSVQNNISSIMFIPVINESDLKSKVVLSSSTNTGVTKFFTVSYSTITLDPTLFIDAYSIPIVLTTEFPSVISKRKCMLVVPEPTPPALF